MNPKPANRRASQRRRARQTVRVQCRKGSLGLGPDVAVQALDISETGVRLVVAQTLEELAEVEVVIDGYGLKGAIKRLGNVRWQVPMDNGQFCVGIHLQKRLSYQEWQTVVPSA